MSFSCCSLQVFIPEWPVEEGWEDRMCKHLKKVIDNHFRASIKLNLFCLKKHVKLKHLRSVNIGQPCLDEKAFHMALLYSTIYGMYMYSLQAGSHLGAHTRAAKSEFKSEVIQQGRVW